MTVVVPFRTSGAVRSEHETARVEARVRETHEMVAAQLERIRRREAGAARWRRVRERGAAAGLVFGAVFSGLLGRRVPPGIAALFAGGTTLTLAAVALAVEQLQQERGK
jgi:hypothetical protein